MYNVHCRVHCRQTDANFNSVEKFSKNEISASHAKILDDFQGFVVVDVIFSTKSSTIFMFVQDVVFFPKEVHSQF